MNVCAGMCSRVSPSLRPWSWPPRTLSVSSGVLRFGPTTRREPPNTPTAHLPRTSTCPPQARGRPRPSPPRGHAHTLSGRQPPPQGRAPLPCSPASRPPQGGPGAMPPASPKRLGVFFRPWFVPRPVHNFVDCLRMSSSLISQVFALMLICSGCFNFGRRMFSIASFM